MPKLTELTAANSLANSDLLVVTTNTTGTAVSNSVNVATLSAALSAATPIIKTLIGCLLYTSPSPRDGLLSRMPSSA